MLINVPKSEELNEVALRLYFDAWERCICVYSDFADAFAVDLSDLDSEHLYAEEWNEYIVQAQSELGAISVTIQHAAELRLKSIICETSPFLLLTNGGLSFKSSQRNDIDFAELRTLDAVDLPTAVQTLTRFKLPELYIAQYGNMRRLRNQITHLGSHSGALTPRQLVEILSQQYMSLWPDGRWLKRRVGFDGNSAKRFFHDQRYSSVESDVMLELPYTIKLLPNVVFKKMLGVAKGKLTGFCPACMGNTASKWDVDGHATAHRTSSNHALCAMCEEPLVLQADEKDCEKCGSRTRAAIDSLDPVCFGCGEAE